MQHKFVFTSQSSGWRHVVSDVSTAISAIPPQSKIAVLYGADSDGYTSYLLLKKLLAIKGQTISHSESFLTYQYLFTDFLDQEEETFDIIVSLDIPTVQELQRFLDRYPSSTHIIIDHHQYNGEVSPSDRVEYINPVHRRIDIKERTPVCMIIYCALQLHIETDLQDEILLAAGLLGDSAVRDYPKLTEVLQSTLKYDEKGDHLSTPFGMLTKAITAYFQLYPSTKSIHPIENAYLNGNLTSVELLSTIGAVSAQFEQAVSREYKLALSIAEHSGIFIYYRLSGSEYVSNIVCRQLSNFHRSKICVVEYGVGNLSQFEFRAADRNLNIVSTLTELGAISVAMSLGGHPSACGAIVDRARRSEFLQILGLART